MLHFLLVAEVMGVLHFSLAVAVMVYALPTLLGVEATAPVWQGSRRSHICRLHSAQPSVPQPPGRHGVVGNYGQSLLLPDRP